MMLLFVLCGTACILGLALTFAGLLEHDLRWTVLGLCLAVLGGTWGVWALGHI
jgi:hypothetical protein